MKFEVFYKSSYQNVLFLGFLIFIVSCTDNKIGDSNEITKQQMLPNEVLPIFQYWNLILGDGSNAGKATKIEHKDYFYVSQDGEWVVFKTPNAGNTHGTSNNTRTELAQLKKWKPMTPAKLKATAKVMNVSSTGDPSIASTHSVVIGQIHSADGHENEPLKIFYKKFPGHKKGSVFWNYEINTKGDDNSGRWDYSYPIWGYDFSVVAAGPEAFPPEPEDGIELGEEMTYEVEIKDGLMHLKFMSEGHETKTFTKNLIESEYATRADMPEQVQNLFVPIGQDGVEREAAYTGEGLFFKLGCYNQTNGKDPKVNRVWCSGAETYGGDLAKQYESGNFAEVWFKDVSIEISEDAYSNAGYFAANDGLSKKTVYPNEVIPFMDKFKILLGDGTNEDDLVKFE
ncbi:MAG: polysaccharide lyase family 7 protein, partial [Bacteroidota bacterium]